MQLRWFKVISVIQIAYVILKSAEKHASDLWSFFPKTLHGCFCMNSYTVIPSSDLVCPPINVICQPRLMIIKKAY